MGELSARFVPYTHIDNLLSLRPNPEILLGKRLDWLEKRDGSNLFLWRDIEGNIHISSRNQPDAAADFKTAAQRTEEYPKIVDYLNNETFSGRIEGNRYGVYVELIVKGLGPTRIEPVNDREQLIIFDIYDFLEDHYLPYVNVYQTCYHWKLPVVERWAETIHSTKESLMETVDDILDMADSKRREGAVIKYVDPSPLADPKFIYAKVKLDIPRLPPIVKHDVDQVVLPHLPESEVRGEWSKMLADYGLEKLKDKVFAMPEFARRVSQAAKENNCRNPSGSLFTFYLKLLEES